MDTWLLLSHPCLSPVAAECKDFIQHIYEAYKIGPNFHEWTQTSKKMSRFQESVENSKLRTVTLRRRKWILKRQLILKYQTHDLRSDRNVISKLNSAEDKTAKPTRLKRLKEEEINFIGRLVTAKAIDYSMSSQYRRSHEGGGVRGIDSLFAARMGSKNSSINLQKYRP